MTYGVSNSDYYELNTIANALYDTSYIADSDGIDIESGTITLDVWDGTNLEVKR